MSTLTPSVTSAPSGTPSLVATATLSTLSAASAPTATSTPSAAATLSATAAAPRETASSPDAAPPTPLYDRLGRRDGIARITRTLIDNHMANPLVNTRYGGSDMAKVERRVVEFFCAGAGGPEAYTGQDMLATHKGMNINEQEFVTVLDDAMAALETHGIDPATRHEVLGILWSMKGEVVRV